MLLINKNLKNLHLNLRKFSTFNKQDILNFNKLLFDEELQMIDSVQIYANKKLLPRVIQDNRYETFDKEIFKEMGNLGLLGSSIVGYGCPGLSKVIYGLCNREIERIDSGYRSAMSVQTSLSMFPIYKFGTETQKSKYLPGMASGDLLGCFGLTEPSNGSDVSGIKTHAKKVKDGYVLNGTKTWITNAPIADLFIIWAVYDDSIRGFILDKNFDGLSTTKITNKLALRASETGTVYLEDVFVPDGNILPNVKGLKGPFSCLNQARYGISWGVIGALENVLERSINYSSERDQFNTKLASFQLVQKKLADASTEIPLGLLASLQVGRLMDTSDDIWFVFK